MNLTNTANLTWIDWLIMLVYDRALGIDLNLTWGGLMFLFGAVMFVVGRRRKWQDDPANPRPWERQPKSRRGR